MPRLIIDDLEVEVPEGTKVIEAAERLGIMIPRFCYHEAMGSIGACRMCAVKFLQGPFKGVQMSCMIDAQDGMVVSTTDEEAVAFRRYVIEWLMLNHPHDCPVCDEGGQCLLQDETISGGHGIRRYLGPKRTYHDQYLGIFIAHEMNRCIHCYRCSRFYQEFCGYRDLGAMQIGNRVYFGRYEDGQLESPFSGNLVDICPVGVYTDKPARYKVRRWHLRRAPSVCIHCSLGCNTVGNAHYRGVLRVEARVNQAVNGHFICDAGRFTFSYANGGADHTGRPWHPRIDGVESSFDAAVRAGAERLSGIIRDAGPGAVACAGSSRNSLETQAMLKRFCRVLGMRPPHFFFDPAAGSKVRTAVSRLDERLAVSLNGIQQADFILAVGVDPINEAPMLAFSMRQAFRKEAPIVVVDPRPVSLPFDFHHLPVAPHRMDECLGAFVKAAVRREDIAGLGGGAEGFHDALPSEYPHDAAVRERMAELAPLLAKSRNPAIICGTDVVEVSTPAFAADCGLMLSGVKGRTGLFYVLPGANSFGAGLLTPEDADTFESTLDAVENGSVKALLLVESDPFRYYPDRERLDRALEQLDLLMVLDYVDSEAVRRANVFLPASTVFETGATFVNQEGRVQFAERVHSGGIPIWGTPPPRSFRDYVPGGEHQPGWQTLSDIARALGGASAGGGDAAVAGPFTAPAEELPAFSRAGGGVYPLDGIRIIPARSDAATFESRVDSRTERAPSEGLHLLLVEWIFSTEELAGYSSDIVAPVMKEPFLCMHPEDAARAGLSGADRVRLHLDRGTLDVELKVSDGMARGVIILPRHCQLPWQKLKGFSPMVAPGGIERV